ncbi:DUF2087 domain-containing protein [Streptacidiphilus monticola]|jgi:hypothetical protein|uniref:DUF2087 domain-containing protein n=1 Tax=Streptacidiphilus monticola TaxID=2161674 RepID=A0ABW1FTW8_9ACTN
MSSSLGPFGPLAAALADPVRLELYARTVVAGPAGLVPAGAAERKVLARLAQAGLVRLAEDGTATAVVTAFADALRPARPAAEAQDEVAGLLQDGRITAIPVRPAKRRALLEYVTARAFRPGEHYAEPEVNMALRQYWDDYPALRRYLVESGLLTRSADGSSYRVAA